MLPLDHITVSMLRADEREERERKRREEERRLAYVRSLPPVVDVRLKLPPEQEAALAAILNAFTPEDPAAAQAVEALRLALEKGGLSQ